MLKAIRNNPFARNSLILFSGTKKHHIVNPTTFTVKKVQKNIYAYFVIQDTSLTGINWHLSYWYYDDPNRYVETIYNWIFDKELTKLKENDIIMMKNNYTMGFTVYNSKYAEKSQQKFCKIFIRNLTDFSNEFNI